MNFVLIFEVMGLRSETEDGRPKTEDRRRETEDGRPKTEDGRRKAEDRRRKTEVWSLALNESNSLINLCSAEPKQPHAKQHCCGPVRFLAREGLTYVKF
ncbi:MAG: hypothetical protein Q7U59_11650 [Lutibacter sp.]|nr:hypothetical protein [Lutibacter sp.]